MGNKKDVDIYPSVMCCKPWDLEAYVRAFEEAGVAGIHFDVMDGHYVPNIMLGSEDLRQSDSLRTSRLMSTSWLPSQSALSRISTSARETR